MESLIKDFKVNINTTYTDFISNINNIINEKENSITKLNAEISEYKIKLKTLTRQYNLLNEECENFQKVSIVKNLNTQLFEKENIIKFLNKKIETLKNKNIKMNINDVKPTVTSSTNSNSNSKGSVKVEAEDVEDVEVEDGENLEDVEVEDGEDVEDVEDGENLEDVEVEDGENLEDVEDGENLEDVEGEDVEDVEVEDGENVEVEEVEFYEKKLKSPTTKKMAMYYITDDANKEIYEKLEDDEIGECIGKLVGKNNRPHFY
jgi:hypothetical protein